VLGVSQDRIAQRRVAQPCDHRNLDGGQDLPRTDTEGRKPEETIAISLHESLHEPAGLLNRARRLASEERDARDGGKPKS
jgi:hypothetical protein